MVNILNMDASEFFKEPGMNGEVETHGVDEYLWFISYDGDANLGMEDTHECHDVTWDDYCEAAEIITRKGYTILTSNAEHDYVSATFIRTVNHSIPEDERCKYCHGTGRWRDG